MVFALQQILINCLIVPDYIRFRIGVIGIPVFVIISDLLGIIDKVMYRLSYSIRNMYVLHVFLLPMQFTRLLFIPRF